MLSIISRLTMTIPELEEYHRAQRKKWFEQGKMPKKIRFREICYPVFRLFLTVDRLSRKQTVTILNASPRRVVKLFTPALIFLKMIWKIFMKSWEGAVGGLLVIHVLCTGIFPVCLRISMV
ncbi:MAG: hypothetical protein MRZ84_05745 [Eubacterium sp.]|nr:hypothetical protein [Eubacterium sp.]